MKYARLFSLVFLPFLVFACSYLNMIDDVNVPSSGEQKEGDYIPEPSNDDSQYYYYFYDEMVHLKERKDMVYIKFIDSQEKESFLSELHKISSLRLWNPDDRREYFEETPLDFIVLESVVDDIPDDWINEIKRKESVLSVSFLVEYQGRLSAVTGDIVVKPRFAYNISELKRIAESLDCELSTREWLSDNTFIFSLKTTSEVNTILLSKRLYETGEYEIVSPNFLYFNLKASPNYNTNTYYFEQWGLKNYGQNGNGIVGIDINAEQAWSITQGSDDIIVAVLDDGVELSHPDLSSNLIAGYNTYLGIPSGTVITSYDDHGTPVCGIIGALDNDIGVIGVAANCKMMPISIFYYGYSDDDMIVAGLYWARTHGADVINCSWAGSNPSTVVSTEISNATSLGRNGKGCVVVCGSGNDNGAVSFPATLNNVLSVGAISIDGNRKTPTSPDGEYGWGSNYGSQLDVVGPGVRLPSTDLLDTYGYNSEAVYNGYYSYSEYNDKDYTRYFGGTSGACAHVSGVAALMLSEYPDLSQFQVRRAIELGSTKIAGYTFTSDGQYPSGTHNNEVGYGLLNAYNSLLQADDAHQNNLLDVVPGIDFTINNNSSYILDDIYVDLSGYISGNYTSFISQDPGGVANGQEIGYPLYRGESIYATGGTPITNISLDFFASTPGYYGNLRIAVAIDNPNPSSYEINNFGFGASAQFNLPNSTVPTASRRRLYIDVRDPL